MEFFRDYCDESNHEFFADGFVAYILWPEEMATNAPTVYRHIETCLHEMKPDLEETNYERDHRGTYHYDATEGTFDYAV